MGQRDDHATIILRREDIPHDPALEQRANRTPRILPHRHVRGREIERHGLARCRMNDDQAVSLIHEHAAQHLAVPAVSELARQVMGGQAIHETDSFDMAGQWTYLRTLSTDA